MDTRAGVMQRVALIRLRQLRLVVLNTANWT